MKTAVFRKATFNSAHRLHNPLFDDKKNQEIFGLCNNPNYHGHNYDLIVKLVGDVDQDTGYLFDLKVLNDIIKEDIRIPYSPSTIYKSEWVGWVDFLDTDNIDNREIEYVCFEQARDFARSLKFKLHKQWRLLDINFLKINLVPKKPERTYMGKGWIDWYDFLGIDEKTKMSHGEVLISNFLDENKIKYNYNKSLKDCISSSKLRFDFYLTEYNICIEFDGIQHFFPCEMFGGEEEFQKSKIRDSIKNEWCLVNEIKLIRFKYKQKKDEIESLLRKELKLNKLLNE